MLDKKIKVSVIVLFLLFSFCSYSQAGKLSREERRKQELDELKKHFEWWPTDAKPGPVKDPERGGYWWWPT